MHRVPNGGAPTGAVSGSMGHDPHPEIPVAHLPGSHNREKEEEEEQIVKWKEFVDGEIANVCSLHSIPFHSCSFEMTSRGDLHRSAVG